MAELTVEMTYGKALFEAAKEIGKVDIILEEIREIRNLFREEPDFYEFINTPILAKAKKKEALEKIFTGRISPEVINFLYILIDKRRTKNFNKIVDQYEKIIDASEGTSSGDIYSAEALTEEQLLAFEEKTGKLLRKNVKLENKMDASILGGVKIFVEGKVIDATIRKRLQDLELSLNNATL